MLHLGEEAKRKMQKGANDLADMVKVTLGPRGRNIILDRMYGTPLITNDGISIAKEVILKDKVENMGASLVREAASRTNDIGGDGTTSATVLSQAMINEGFKCVMAGANPILIRRGMYKALGEVLVSLDNLSIPVGEDIESIASISAGDESIGAIVAKAIKEVGSEGVVTIEESTKPYTSLETTIGLKIERGYMSPYMVTDTEKMKCELNNAYVLIVDEMIDVLDEILHIIEEVSSAKGKLLIIAQDMGDDALSTLVVNKLRGSLNCCVIKAPVFAGDTNEYLEDIALVTGATVISRKTGLDVADTDMSHLGMAGKVIIHKDSTVISDGYGNKEAIEKQVVSLRERIETGRGSNKDILKNRLGKLVGGVAVIKAGSPTEIETKELKLRIEDAVNATKAALEEGIVPGGGTALIIAGKDIKVKSKIREEQIGIDIVKKALDVPLWQIATNAGEKGDSVVSKVKNLKRGYGFDALECKYKDMIAGGIIDPVKVTKAAITNSVSISSSFLTTEGAVTINNNKGE